MFLRITILCFAASYAVALACEISRLWFRSGIRGFAMILFAGAGLLAHTIFLGQRAIEAGAGSAPWSSWFDWYLLAAWTLAALYLFLTARGGKSAIGLFLLPAILGLVGVTTFIADRSPFPRSEAGAIWGRIHGVFLLLGTVAVIVGFLAGLMYLLHAYRLKRKKLPPLAGLRLPSLEWLDRTNERALFVSALLVAAGLISGVILNAIHRADGKTEALPWTDPVVWSSGLLLIWLGTAVLFNALYKPARQGRKVAYLTIASFVLLALILAALLLLPTQHTGPEKAGNDSSAATPCRSKEPRMKLQMVGCSHHTSNVGVREQLAFSEAQVGSALDQLRGQFPQAEVVLLSTCNRVEVYTAADDPAQAPSQQDVAQFLTQFHGLELQQVSDELLERTDEAAVRHLFTVAASLDSMVVGEPQILAQVKQAYQLAQQHDSTGPLTHEFFQAALRVAKRVATETAINEKRVSVASVAIDFAGEIFEQLDDKQILIVGAGEMAEETLRYLREQGARNVTVVNRSAVRAGELADEWQGRAIPWEQLDQAVIEADLIVSTTAATEPVFTLDRYLQIEERRYQRPLLILDLAIPRDFDPAIGERLGVYLYAIDDLQAACERNRRERDRELPAAQAIVEEETARFMADAHHRATGPLIQRVRTAWQAVKNEELKRLFNKLPQLDEQARREIEQTFDRYANKLLHPPLESLRDESRHGIPHALVDAFKRLFKLKD